MKKLSVFISAALLSSTVALAPMEAYAKLPSSVNGQQMPSLAPMLDQITPAVVSISVVGKQQVQSVPDAFRYFFGNPRSRQQPQEKPFRGLGSGVIIDAKDGYIVTNNHVVDHADEILVTLKDGRQFEAKKIGSDEKSDIALLQIEAQNLTEIQLADSDELRVGDFAVAIGSPFGLGQTVTSGIVSALGRSGLNASNFEDFIQTDAAINSGNSGGALVNLNGELIGINTAIIGPSGGNVGIGFAIPSNMMKNLVSQITEFGEVRRGLLGISGRNLNAEIAEALGENVNQGAFIEQITPDSAAEDAGLKAGDIVIAIDDKKIRSFSELRGKVGSIGAGKKVKLTILREGKKKSYTITLRQDKSSVVVAASIHRMLDGAQLANNTTRGGVEITELAEDSPAEYAGLQEGDIIIGVNRKRIENVGQLRDSLTNTKGIIALNVVRGNSSLYLMIR